MVIKQIQNVHSSFGEDKSSLPSSIDFIQKYAAEKQDDDLMLLTTTEKQVQGVLGELQYIREILETNKKVAPVEDMPRKIKVAYEKIKALLNPQNEASLTQDLENANRRTSGGINVEPNPLIKEMGGMPLEVISPEWQELIEGQILDKAELENLVNKKLKDKVDLANKLTHKLKNKLTNQPKPKSAPVITPKFEKKLKETLNYILKNTPEPPRPTRHIPPPRPQGM